MDFVSGFSKKSKEEKLAWLAAQVAPNNTSAFEGEFKSFWHEDKKVQDVFDEFSENTLTNFYMPYGIAPNFVINDKPYAIPMVIEESSVVAAAAKAAKFWQNRGGFRFKVLSTTKIGQLHFRWAGEYNKLYAVFDELEDAFRKSAASITKNMDNRGGGIRGFELLDMRDLEENYYQIRATFETCDSMGANFINSCLEDFGKTLARFLVEKDYFAGEEEEVTILMAILSNYTPQSIVRAWVECPVEELPEVEGLSNKEFAKKFRTAVKIARKDPYRATTHNKGIFNGIDSVVLATGNDFRAVEACGHTHASRDGQYRSLTDCEVENGIFRFWLDLPLAVGTVGGLTKLHPMVRRSLEILGNPDAPTLMGIIAVTGLAQNFGAVRSLTTTGIQKGHMKMHLLNILRSFEATEDEKEQALEYFKTNVVSVSSVRELLEKIRDEKNALS